MEQFFVSYNKQRGKKFKVTGMGGPGKAAAFLETGIRNINLKRASETQPSTVPGRMRLAITLDLYVTSDVDVQARDAWTCTAEGEMTRIGRGDSRSVDELDRFRHRCICRARRNRSFHDQDLLIFRINAAREQLM